MKDEVKILVKENLLAENIKINLVKKDLNFSDEVEKIIEEIWVKKEKEIEKNGGNFYNGKSYRMIGWKYKNGTLDLDFATMDFKHRFGAIQILKNKIFDASKVWHGGCHVGASLKTSDGKYLMVKISGKSINTNKYDFAGGIVEDDMKFMPTGEFLFQTVEKEMNEEAGIEKKDIEKISLEMVFQAKEAYTGFYFSGELNTSSKELIKRFKNNQDQDIDSLIFFTEEEYKEVLRNHNKNKKLIFKEFFKEN